jgi:hypothetical protein
LNNTTLGNAAYSIGRCDVNIFYNLLENDFQNKLIGSGKLENSEFSSSLFSLCVPCTRLVCFLQLQ